MVKALALAACVAALFEKAYAAREFVVVKIGGLDEASRFYGELARMGTEMEIPQREKDAETMELWMEEGNEFGCEAFGKVPENAAVVVKRGLCSFENKTIWAKNAGAKAVVVVNTVEALYNATSEMLYNPCSVNCEVSESEDRASCEEMCPSKFCANNPLTVEKYCCVVATETTQMQIGNKTKIVAVFVGLGHAREMLSATAASKKVQFFKEDEKIYPDGSMIVILLIGTVVVSLASYRAARAERTKAGWLWDKELAPLQSERASEPPNARDTDAEIDSVVLSFGAVASFIVFTTAALVGLFFLAKYYPRETVITIQVLFGLSAWFAFSYFVVQPIIRFVWRSGSDIHISIRGYGLGSASECIGSAISLTVVVIWFTFRHENFAWILLDMLAASVCALFLVSIRVPNLQLACGMLGLFFLYDIFMVFISPLFTGGSSIMVDVAQAGATAAKAESSLVCTRYPRERMPMLFLVPRFSDGEYALLGLGDIFIPGLLITFACRFDYLKAEAAGIRAPSWLSVHKYFVPLCIAYFLGLGVTLLANLYRVSFGTNVKGQPALLYLVPFTTLTFVGLAKLRKDLTLLWTFSYEEVYGQLVRRSDSDSLSDGSNTRPTSP